MAETTNISWCDSTFNPVVGCERISPACDFCYAASWAKRTGQDELWNGTRRRTTESNWRKPLQWEREHEQFEAEHGHRRRVFCASLADVFDNAWDPRWRSDLFKLIDATRHLDWLLLTKRIGNVRTMCGGVSAWPNVWLGATIANQEEADRDIPKLLATPARVRFLSIEPILGPIDLEYPEGIWPNGPPMCCDGRECACRGQPIDPPLIHGISWVIGGGESGPKARPWNPMWARSLRDQCAAWNVPFHWKQHGEWSPEQSHPVRDSHRWPIEIGEPAGGVFSFRVGKKAAGRTLDGVIHDAFPTTAVQR